MQRGSHGASARPSLSLSLSSRPSASSTDGLWKGHLEGHLEGDVRPGLTFPPLLGKPSPQTLTKTFWFQLKGSSKHSNPYGPYTSIDHSCRHHACSPIPSQQHPCLPPTHTQRAELGNEESGHVSAQRPPCPGLERQRLPWRAGASRPCQLTGGRERHMSSHNVGRSNFSLCQLLLCSPGCRGTRGSDGSWP